MHPTVTFVYDITILEPLEILNDIFFTESSHKCVKETNHLLFQTPKLCFSVLAVGESLPLLSRAKWMKFGFYNGNFMQNININTPPTFLPLSLSLSYEMSFKRKTNSDC